MLEVGRSGKACGNRRKGAWQLSSNRFDVLSCAEEARQMAPRSNLQSNRSAVVTAAQLASLRSMFPNVEDAVISAVAQSSVSQQAAVDSLLSMSETANLASEKRLEASAGPAEPLSSELEDLDEEGWQVCDIIELDDLAMPEAVSDVEDDVPEANTSKVNEGEKAVTKTWRDLAAAAAALPEPKVPEPAKLTTTRTTTQVQRQQRQAPEVTGEEYLGPLTDYELDHKLGGNRHFKMTRQMRKGSRRTSGRQGRHFEDEE